MNADASTPSPAADALVAALAPFLRQTGDTLGSRRLSPDAARQVDAAVDRHHARQTDGGEPR